MLHPLNRLPMESHMRELLALQRNVLAFALDKTQKLDKTHVTAYFGDAGDWVWARAKRGKSPTIFGRLLEALMQHAKDNPALV